MPNTLLIDADVIVHQEVRSAATSVDWGDVCSMSVDMRQAKASSDYAIKRWMSKLGADDVLLCFSDPDRRNFRRAVLDTYKSNRTGPRPPGFNELVGYLQTVYPSLWYPFLEADDVMGIQATSRKYRGNSCIVSIDKDMKGVSGYFYHLKSYGAEGTLYDITSRQAERFHLLQTLTGDLVDGYKGCPKVGPVNADRILDNLAGRDAWEAVVGAYAVAGLSEADALQQARCAYILQTKNFVKSREEIKLWNPPKS